MTYDVQRYDLAPTTQFNLTPNPKGRYVLAANAEAHERAAVETAILSCLAALNTVTYEKVREASRPPRTARDQVYTVHALAGDAMRALLRKEAS